MEKSNIKLTITKLAVLFFTFFKLGLFTFGGGYAMIPLIQNEVAVKKKWIRADEIGDILTISESTPGPIAVNSSTYIGYKVCGIPGAIFSTLGLILPSFIILYVISLFIEDFMQIEIIANAFLGIKSAVSILIFSGAYTIYKTVNKNIMSYIIMFIVCTMSVCFTIFDISFSSIYYILGAGLFGIVYAVIKIQKDKLKTLGEEK